MDPERYERLSKLFRDACDLEAHERDEFLGRACASDPTLRDELESLLAHDETATVSDSDATPELVGPYRLLEKIGEGGMGEVWLAEQEQPVRRRVAVKLIKIGMDTRQVIARFEAERQALALMEHPAIAKVFDAGATGQGRPYFSMEYVKGESITAYCDRNRLTTDERLELFMQVCDGVQHAHQKGIIHRDIKPSNVLVQIHDDKSAPKIIDFGVAKATQQRLTEKTVYTQRGMLIGTPEYMSPEQAEMTGLDVDTRSDVYSLGVLLYELLVGALPFDPRELRAAGFDEIRRKIREDEPSKPSTRISTLGGASQTSAQNRGTDPRSLSRQLRGDLDWITMKALEKDRTRRFGSPGELAADIRRHLNDKPVQACPPSASYEARKFVRRHRFGVVSAALLAMAFLIGMAGTTVGLLRALRAENAAMEEAATAEQVSQFLVETFLDANPGYSAHRGDVTGQTVTARELLDRGAERIHVELGGQPAVQARLMDTIGIVYMELGATESAFSLVEDALRIRRAHFGDNHPDTAESLRHLAHFNGHERDYAEAESLAREALRLFEEALGSDHTDVLLAVNELAIILLEQRKFAEAESLFHRILQTLEKADDGNEEGVPDILQSLARISAQQDRLTEAEEFLKRSLDLHEAAVGPDHPRVANVLMQLGSLYADQQKYADAESLLQRSLALQEKVLAPDHLFVARVLARMGSLYLGMGKYSDAAEAFQRQLEIYRKHYPEGNALPGILDNLAWAYMKAGEYDKAEELFRQSIEGQDPVSPLSLKHLANVYFHLGKLSESASYFEQALATGEEQLGEHQYMVWILADFAPLRLAQGRYSEAEELCQRAIALAKKILGEDHPNVARGLFNLAEVYVAQERDAEAEPRYRRALEIREQALPADHPDVETTRQRLAALLGRTGRDVESAELVNRRE